jgi:OmcA/MtrC family decaheme c-type cytochrome
MRTSRMLLILLSFVLPVLLLGCGNDGATGAAGEPGAPGPGALANETCVLCHGEGKIVDVAVAHDTLTGTVAATITGAEIATDNASVTFTFSATGVDGTPMVVDLTEAATGSTNLRYLRFTIAKLVPGAGVGDPDQWDFYGARSHRSAAQLTNNGDGTYTFTFDNTVRLDPAEEDLTHRVGFELNIGEFPASARLRSVNPTFDWVPDGVTPITTREIVTTAACNQCHDPLGVTPRFHGSRRVDTAYCVLCHNLNDALAPESAGGEPVPIPFLELVHKIHTAQFMNIFEGDENEGDFTDVTFPQDIRNCTKCHQGGVDSDNWKERPSREACGSCHGIDIFDTGVGHGGGQQLTNAGCAGCHPPSSIAAAMATENVTPNNQQLPAALSRFEYFLDNVAVDNNGLTTVGFRITQDNVLLDLSTGAWPPPSNTATPIANTSGPSFLLAWALPQDGIDEPAEYTNRTSPDPPSTTNGNGAGDAPGVSLRDLVQDNLVVPSGAGYMVTLTASDWTAPGFPTGATMRAVGLQSYFSQVTPAGNVGRHTPSVVLDVDPNDARRVVVKSGYDADPAAGGQPFGCLECHETLELHGGSRVNNVRICVFCHNPNKSSSGRTANPADPSCSEEDDCDLTVDPFLVLGPDPLEWPEATNNFKNMIHGIHRASDRPYEFVRNRLNGIYYNWSHVTFPGDLMDCEKCHIGDSYIPSNVPANTLWNIERTTTRNPETRADIIGARSSVPNLTDLVDSPIAGACFYCHDEGLAKSHILTQGGKLSIWPSIDTGSGAISREDASKLP